MRVAISAFVIISTISSVHSTYRNTYSSRGLCLAILNSNQSLLRPLHLCACVAKIALYETRANNIGTEVGLGPMSSHGEKV